MSKKNQTEAKQDIKLKSSVKFKIVEEKGKEEKRIIEAYVSIFDNVDLVGDKIIKGAFEESLRNKLPKGVWAHNWDEPIAKTLSAVEDEKGLLIRGQFIEGVQKSDEAYKLIKAGVIDEFSIGFRVLDDEWEEDGTRIIKKAKLYEWSPVLAGANPDTELVSVKDDNKNTEAKCEEEETEEPKEEAPEEEIEKEEVETPEEEKEIDEEVEEEVEEEKKAPVLKVDFVKFNHKDGTVKINYREDGEKKSLDMIISSKYKKYIKSFKDTKVAEQSQGVEDASQILRLVKKQIRDNHQIIRLIRN
jgi:HK97 family phage prohead protease